MKRQEDEDFSKLRAKLKFMKGLSRQKKLSKLRTMEGVPRVDPVIVQREQEEAIRAIKERLGILEE